MKKIIFIVGVLLLAFCSNLIAQDKVVVIPMNSGGKVGGTDKQLQYNNNGVLAGAEVYYDNTNGRLGVGTVSPSAQLEISGENSRVIYSTSAYGDNPVDSAPMFIGRKARGSSLIPAAVMQGDMLTYVGAKGYDGFNWDFLSTGGISFFATENHDEFSKGTGIRFMTTPNGAADKAIRMTITDDGNVGIGTSPMNPPLSRLAVNGLPTAPPDDSGSAILCITANGNLWIDIDATNVCQ
ncbi:MAG: hypothetical protein SCH71_09890 [Desulfobulbaceae bacterium]|nr:hypothetical protein [Desulfobulbaceae bacterium]